MTTIHPSAAARVWAWAERLRLGPSGKGRPAAAVAVVPPIASPAASTAKVDVDPQAAVHAWTERLGFAAPTAAPAGVPGNPLVPGPRSAADRTRGAAPDPGPQSPPATAGRGPRDGLDVPAAAHRREADLPASDSRKTDGEANQTSPALEARGFGGGAPETDDARIAAVRAWAAVHGFGSPEQEVTAAQEAKAPQGPGARAKAWAELLRVPAVFSVPGDALAGAAAAGVRSGRGTGWAVAASLCLYEAGMALNDWADRDEDALARPHRPLPSGRIRPGAALGAAGALTAAGLALAARAGRPALAVAAPLAATVWAYDLGLKHTKAGPAAMAAARGLDLALGAAAAAGKDAFDGPGPVISAAALATHTYAVTMVSRREAEGGSSVAPLAALGTATLLATFVSSCPNPGELDGPVGPRAVAKDFIARFGPTEAVRVAMAAAYWGTFAKPLFHAVLNPSPPLTQQAVGAGIRAMIPLQGALMARAGAPRAALVSAALAPLCAKLARKVSTT